MFTDPVPFTFGRSKNSKIDKSNLSLESKSFQECAKFAYITSKSILCNGTYLGMLHTYLGMKIEF